MSEKDPRDILARENQQHVTLGKNRARMYSSRDHRVQMELDWPHCGNQHLLQPDRPLHGTRWVKGRWEDQ